MLAISLKVSLNKVNNNNNIWYAHYFRIFLGGATKLGRCTAPFCTLISAPATTTIGISWGSGFEDWRIEMKKYTWSVIVDQGKTVKKDPDGIQKKVNSPEMQIEWWKKVVDTGGGQYINSWAVTVLRHETSVIGWTESQIMLKRRHGIGNQKNDHVFEPRRVDIVIIVERREIQHSYWCCWTLI